MRTLLLVLLVTCPALATAQLRPTLLVGDGMVMQRDVPVPVWGEAAPSAVVRVTFDGHVLTTQADAGGAWSVTLPARPAGGPYAMAIESGEERVEVRDVLVGDVWIASGQSNMEWTVAEARDAEAEIARATDGAIRHFKVPHAWAAAPERELPGGAWAVASPSTAGDFTAVGYFFARMLRDSLGIPIGLINTSWGGSRIEPWMHPEALGMESAEAVLAEEQAEADRILAGLEARIGPVPDEDAGLIDGRAVWAAPDLDEAGWSEIPVPGAWEGSGYAGMDGVAWYRTPFDLTAEEAASGVTLGLAMIDDDDVAWVNGVEVGRTSGWNAPRRYAVPPSALRPGRNVLAVRVEDTGGGGGIHGAREAVFVEVGGERRPLPPSWRFRVGAVTVSLDDRKNQVPTVLYNKMVHPLLPYPVRGVIWYQGESNANTLEDARAYRDLFPALIRDWRARWGQPDMPFLWVQLANYMAPDDEPSESAWALLRESQTATLALPHTAQAVAIDLGEADDIHPRNKQDVGARLARGALRVAYGRGVRHTGPVLRAHRVEDGRVMLSFDGAPGGLVARGTDGEVHGFAVAGADGEFVWADARIEGDRVIVWSDRVPEPVAVRYAWGDNPERANLYNADGLPAGPFRTDAW